VPVTKVVAVPAVVPSIRIALVSRRSLLESRLAGLQKDRLVGTPTWTGARKEGRGDSTPALKRRFGTGQLAATAAAVATPFVVAAPRMAAARRAVVGLAAAARGGGARDLLLHVVRDHTGECHLLLVRHAHGDLPRGLVRRHFADADRHSLLHLLCLHD